MTRIDFYVLGDEGEDACMRFACYLCVRALQKQTPVHIHTRDAAHSAELDELMWDYPKHRFVPHALADEDSDPAGYSPIHIGWQPPRLLEGMLINLSPEVPSFFGRFDRVAEIVAGATRQQGRDRYQYYRTRGYPLHHHEMNTWETAS